MKFSICSVRDSKAGAFMIPFFTRNRDTGIRSVMMAMQDPSHEFYKFHDDYTLFELGVYDDDDGSFLVHPAPEVLVTGTALFSSIKRGEN